MDAFTIAHATDLSADGGIAFAHGVALARDAQATLVSLHANPLANVDARDLPDANTLLQQWALKGGAAAEVSHERRTHECCEDPVDTLLDAMKSLAPNLLVVGTHKVSGVKRLFKGSVSESLALNAECPTLFLPIGGRGFVDATGALTVRSALIPVGSANAARVAIAKVVELAARCGIAHMDFHLLHVGDGTALEGVSMPEDPRWTWYTHAEKGDLSAVVKATAERLGTQLVVMATHGQDSVLDFLRGSLTEQVIRVSDCPVMSVPY